LIDEEFTRHPFCGSRKMGPGPNTSRPHPEHKHKVYPYLLRGIQVARPGVEC
jgi:putative transposase